MSIKSFGVAVTVATNGVGGLTDVNISGTDVNFVDITTHESSGGWKQFVGGLKDGGTLELSGTYEVADAGQNYICDNPGVSAACVVTFTDASTCTFTAIVGGYSVTNPLDDVVGYNATLKITGAVVYA